MPLPRLAFFATLVALAVAGCTRPNQFVPPPPPEIDGAYPTAGAVSDYLEFTGSTAALNHVEIRPQVSGKLTSVEFEDGAFVTKGQPLFVIEQNPFKIALAQAQAQLEQATADHGKATAELELAQARLERRAPLAQGGTLSGEEYQVSASAVKTAQAAVASAEAAIGGARAAVRRAELDLEHSVVLSPLDGRIGRRLVDPGNLVQNQTTAMALIETVDPVYAYFNVSDRDVLRLLSLKDQFGGQSGAELALSLDGKEFPYKGTIDWTDLGVDPNTRTQLRRGVFPNADGRLLSGLFVRVRLQIADAEEKVLIEERAIGSDQRGNYVLVIDQPGEPMKTPDGKEIPTFKVEYRPVQLGIAVKDKRVVESGLSLNERIVVNGLQKARPGSAVRISATTPPSPEAQAAALGSTAPATEQADADETPDPGLVDATEETEPRLPEEGAGSADVQPSDATSPAPAAD